MDLCVHVAEYLPCFSISPGTHRHLPCPGELLAVGLK